MTKWENKLTDSNKVKGMKVSWTEERETNNAPAPVKHVVAGTKREATAMFAVAKFFCVVLTAAEQQEIIKRFGPVAKNIDPFDTSKVYFSEKVDGQRLYSAAELVKALPTVQWRGLIDFLISQREKEHQG